MKTSVFNFNGRSLFKGCVVLVIFALTPLYGYAGTPEKPAVVEYGKYVAELFDCTDFKAMQEFGTGRHQAIFPKHRRIWMLLPSRNYYPSPHGFGYEYVSEERKFFKALEITVKIGERDSIFYSEYPLQVVKAEDYYYLGYNMSACMQMGFNNQTIDRFKWKVSIEKVKIVKDVPKERIVESTFKGEVCYLALSNLLHYSRYVEQLELEQSKEINPEDVKTVKPEDAKTVKELVQGAY
jgi:hypothetical protein